ncbi:hypothetical protein ACFX15_006922 [Malus domestica]
MENPNFPTDIMLDILSRLPVKSLCRFRCVSKSWRSLVTDPDFVKIHLNKAFENVEIFHQRRRLMFSDGSHRSLYSLDLDEFLNHNDAVHNYLDEKENDNDINTNDDDDEAVATELDYIYSEIPNNWVFMVFHCNGLLLCQLYNWEFYLVNPATRKSKKLPDIPSSSIAYYFDLFGFGFDHSTDDYKMVDLRYLKGGIMFIVYTLKTGSWREIQRRYPYKSDLMLHGILLSGGLHWLVNRVRGSSSVIISFDLAEEHVQEIPLPCDLVDAKGFKRKNHDLLVFKDRLFMYNFNGERFRKLSVSGFPIVTEVGIYLESLVSPNSCSGGC